MTEIQYLNQSKALRLFKLSCLAMSQYIIWLRSERLGLFPRRNRVIFLVTRLRQNHCLRPPASLPDGYEDSLPGTAATQASPCSAAGVAS